MDSELPRFFLRCLVWSLGALVACYALTLVGMLVPNEGLKSLIILLGYPLWYVSFFGIVFSMGLLFLCGVVKILLRVVDKSPSTSEAKDTANVSLYTLLGKYLTSYKEKHYPNSQGKTLKISLAGFEKAAKSKLPRLAYEQSSWWTDASAHAQQWLDEGWRAISTNLTDEEPNVVFLNILLENDDAQEIAK